MVTKRLKISLNDEDTGWGVYEKQYRWLMRKCAVPIDYIPFIDEQSTATEREFMFEQVLKEVKNIIEANKEALPEATVPVLPMFLISLTATFVLLFFFLI